MFFVPTHPDQSSPTWGHACGLLSFQLMGVMIASLAASVLAAENGIASSVLVTILSSILYLILAERVVSGSLSRKRYRVLLALRASVLLSVLSVGVTLVYSAPGAVESERLLVLLGLLLAGAVVSGVSILIGLELGAKLVKRQRSRHSPRA